MPTELECVLEGAHQLRRQVGIVRVVEQQPQVFSFDLTQLGPSRVGCGHEKQEGQYGAQSSVSHSGVSDRAPSDTKLALSVSGETRGNPYGENSPYCWTPDAIMCWNSADCSMLLNSADCNRFSNAADCNRLSNAADCIRFWNAADCIRFSK